MKKQSSGLPFALNLERDQSQWALDRSVVKGQESLERRTVMAMGSVGPQYVFAGVPEYKRSNFIFTCQLETLVLSCLRFSCS